MHRRYDLARTPYQRLLSSPEISEEVKRALTEVYRALNPAELKRRIGRCQDRLLSVARAKPRERRKEVSNPPDHPWKAVFSFRPEVSTRTSLVRQRTAPSRTS